MENTRINWKKIKHFSSEEFRDPDRLDLVAMIKLDNAREIANTPFVITSAWREDKDSAHNTGKAFDIRCHNDRDRWHILNGLFASGFKRIGIYNKHIHADTDSSRDNFVVWTGKSR